VIPRARVIPGGERSEARPEIGQGGSSWRRVTRELLDARAEASRILESARAQAEELLAAARLEAENAIRRAEDETRAHVMAEWLAFVQKEKAQLDRDDRIVPIAIALAERLLCSALELDPSRIANLARDVLGEARGVRRAILSANPLDAATLKRELDAVGLDTSSVEIREDAGLARGELRVHTDLGEIDARLGPRFERLSRALRDALAAS
jgi:flagellar assembly protein FliH